MPLHVFKNGSPSDVLSVDISFFAAPSVCVFESMRVYDGVIFKLEEHLVRLKESARSVGLIDLGAKQSDRQVPIWREALLDAVLKADADSATLRITVSATDYWVTVHPLKLPSSDVYTHGVKLRTATVRKGDMRTGMPQAKSSEYVPGVMATHELFNGGDADDMVYVDTAGVLLEGRTQNIFLVKNNAVFTPPRAGILDGVTRRTVIELLPRLRISFSEIKLTRHELYTSDEAFLTYTSGEVIPIRMADGRVIGRVTPGPLTHKIHAAYRKAADDYVKKHHRKTRR